MSRANTKGAAKKLRTYTKKRDVERTPEPSGGNARRPSKGLLFVVQKHAARQLHYDFRLELGGVLLSWAVPKGPSVNPDERRLAVRTEDHPLDYKKLEGANPGGENGGGAVIVWDRGRWTPEGDPVRGLETGRLTFDLHGERLRGRFHLVRTRGKAGDRREPWLLFKGKPEEEGAAVDGAARGDSVLNARRLEEVREELETPRGKAAGTTKSKTAGTKTSKAKVSGTKRSKAAAAKTSKAKTSDTKQSKAPGTAEIVKRLELPFALTNLDKLLYPEVPLRKADVIAYYASIANVMLPQVAGRPLSLLRCPNGVGEKKFFQKHVSKGLHESVRRLPNLEAEGSEESMAVDDSNGLLALAQLGVLEVHTWGCHATSPERPDKLIFDIDPDPELAWSIVVDAAVEVRQRLSDVGIVSFVQTTGGKGLHVVAPLHPKLTWDEHMHFAHALALAMAEDSPKRYVTIATKSARKGRVFLDYLRNVRGATSIAPYSTRAQNGATVAAPITWDELMEGVSNKHFTLRKMIKRIARPGHDPWPGYAELRQSVSGRAMREIRGKEV